MNLTNQTEEELEASFSCDNLLVRDYRYFAAVWGSLVSATGTVGNLFTILAFASNSQLRSRFNVLIVNLAAADLLYCTLLQPISVDSYLHLRWRCGAHWCRIFGLLLFVSNAVSIVTLCLIAVSRYLLVARRSLFHLVFTNRGLVLLLTFTWSFALVSFGPLWSVYVFVPKVCTCSFHRTRGRPYTSILLFFYFFVGLLCVGVFYLLIYRHVRISAKALQRYRLSRHSSRKKPVVTLVESGTDCSGATGSCRVEWSSQTDLGRTKLDRTELEQTKQEQTNLDRTKLDWTNHGRTNVGWTKQDQTDMDKTKLCQATVGWTKPDQTDMDRTEKDQTNVGRTAPCQTNLDRTNLDQTLLDWTDQDRANLNGTKLNRTDLGKATPDNHAEKQVTPAATAASSAAPPFSTAPAGEAPPTTTTGSSHTAASADNSDVKRVTRMCFMVFLCFVFCFLPFLLINVLDKHNSAPPVLHMVCANLTWLNSCINPLLYAVMNRQFRQAYRALLTRAATPFTCLWAGC